MNEIMLRGKLLKEKVKTGYKNFIGNSEGASTLEWLIMAFLALGIAVFLWNFRDAVTGMIEGVITELGTWTSTI